MTTMREINRTAEAAHDARTAALEDHGWSNSDIILWAGTRGPHGDYVDAEQIGELAGSFRLAGFEAYEGVRWHEANCTAADAREFTDAGYTPSFVAYVLAWITEIRDPWLDSRTTGRGEPNYDAEWSRCLRAGIPQARLLGYLTNGDIDQETAIFLEDSLRDGRLNSAAWEQLVTTKPDLEIPTA